VCVCSDENMTLTIDAVATTVGNMNHNGKTQTMMSLNQLTDAERDEVWRRHTIGIDEPGTHDAESKSSERSDKPRKKQSKKSSRDKRKKLEAAPDKIETDDKNELVDLNALFSAK